MRASVVVIATVMLVAAVGLLSQRIELATTKVEVPPPAVQAVLRVPVSNQPVELPRSLPTADAPRHVAPTNRFLSGEGLWDAYQSLRRSTHGGELWVAEHILRTCFFDTRTGPAVEQILAGTGILVDDEMSPKDMEAVASGKEAPKNHREAASPDQVVVAKELATRCNRFASLTTSEYRAQSTDVKSRRQHADDPVSLAEAIQEHRTRDTDDHLRTVLDSQDPVAFAGISSLLADRPMQRLGRPMTEDDLLVVGLAIQLIQCDLGNDCSTTSESALMGCVMWAANCRLDLHAQLMSHEIPPIQQMIEHERLLMVQAIRSGNYTMWGL